MKSNILSELTKLNDHFSKLSDDDFVEQYNKAPHMDYRTDIQEALEPVLGKEFSCKLALAFKIETNKYDQEVSEIYVRFILQVVEKIKKNHKEIDLIKHLSLEDAILYQSNTLFLQYVV